MTKLKVWMKSESNSSPGSKVYSNEINADNYKEIAIVFRDLKNFGKPVDKAIKEYKSKNSDWDEALRF
jgi:hypothetical protein